MRSARSAPSPIAAGQPSPPGSRRGEGRGRHEGAQRGSATAEFALALPAVVLVLLAVLAAAATGAAQVRCADAARVGAREFALGQDEGAARGAASEIAGAEAIVTISVAGRWVRVRVERQVVALWGRSLTVSAESAALREPGEP